MSGVPEPDATGKGGFNFTMKSPFGYFARIMGCLPGHTPVEFVRFKRPIASCDWLYWTREISDQWQVWVERPIREQKYLHSPQWGRKHPHAGYRR